MNRIEIIRSTRKTLSVEVSSDCRLIVRAPLHMKDRDIQRFLAEKTDWIETHLNMVLKRQAQCLPELSDAEVKQLAEAALTDLPMRVGRYAAQMGVTVSRITIRSQRTRWGSCSARGNLNLNCLLMLCPEEIRDYVVVHELSHRLELNHSPRFWAQVERVLPDYRERRRWLKENGTPIIGRRG